MNFGRLFRRAKQEVDERGGVEALKDDAQELSDVAKSKGSATDKAKAASEALKDPGAPGGEQPRRDRPEGGRSEGARSESER